MLVDIPDGFFIAVDSGSILLTETVLCKCGAFLIFLVCSRIIGTLFHHSNQLINRLNLLVQLG